MKKFPLIIPIFILTTGVGNGYEASTRMIYQNLNNMMNTLSMDSHHEISVDLWRFPGNVQQNDQVELPQKLLHS
ncbi:hypothetical protein HHL23_21290 [Chryseobacterium sp. RP-3-3]|uniref:Uncharacterized protein n=1 Tax=Chryseobacterium antibioticum TaxID=2728847 RepID=A0A7Y0FTH2_9FLAO|nr:hypothetical protein [Chryseobacterium antibioticum]NML72298.1 hypothetical protein [Chryseobacterium antibioticum]